ncbi:MAG TPA: ATP synthase subunit I, partial [Hydrogenothermaceae bacterium]|nr:ATP synthase subunit I [Hydrogenothermaceae bacterium]
MSDTLFYILFFFVGLIAGGFYFTHLWKSVNAYKSDKGKIIFSSFIRFP